MKYTTIAVLSLPAGVVLGLTEAQAAPRQTVLSAVPARKGWYTTTAAVQFKVGEAFLFDDDLPKHLAQAVQDAAKAATAAEHKAKAKAKATTKADTPAPEPEQG